MIQASAWVGKLHIPTNRQGHESSSIFPAYQQTPDDGEKPLKMDDKFVTFIRYTRETAGGTIIVFVCVCVLFLPLLFPFFDLVLWMKNSLICYWDLMWIPLGKDGWGGNIKDMQRKAPPFLLLNYHHRRHQSSSTTHIVSVMKICLLFEESQDLTISFPSLSRLFV